MVNEKVKKETTTETLGISAEKAVCDAFGLPIPENYEGRYSMTMVNELLPVITKAFTGEGIPAPVKSTGAMPGMRGGSSKCSHDFILEEDKTLSLKTNSGRKVCPPEVGQPGADTCSLYFGEYLEGGVATPESFKKMVLSRIDTIFQIYVKYLFDSDYLLWIFRKKGKLEYKVFEKDFASDIQWEANRFSFTRDSLENWNVSTTLKYDGVSIGEFEVHQTRSSFKFRFILDNFSNLVKTLQEAEANTANEKAA